MNRIDGMNPALTGRTMEGHAAQAAERTADGGVAAGETGSSRGRQDHVSVSDRARVISLATAAVAGAPDARAEKVAALKASIANGTYSIEPQNIAARLLRGGSFD